MAASNTTLTSLWVDDAGQASPMKTVVTSSGRTLVASGSGFQDDVIRFYKDTGLEPVAKEAGIIDINGEFTAFTTQVSQPKTVQMIAVPVSPGRTPLRLEQAHFVTGRGQTLYTTSGSSPVIISTPQRVMSQVMSSPRTTQLMATPIHFDSPHATPSSGRKRQLDIFDSDYSDSKRGKKGEKGGKGLRHFSMKVCEKVQKKGITSYNEVADELVAEFSDPRNMTPTDQYDQKNIRRRVYDALNVLMAMNIISKEKKEIKWIGLPTNSAQECQNLESERVRRLERIQHKTQQLQELILQQIAFKNLVQRNRNQESTQGPPPPNSAIQLPFIIVNTSKKTVIDCSISNDKCEYLFNFDNTFEIHDDIEVLKRMGMAFGLEKGKSSAEELKKAAKMVPKALEPYVIELANTGSSQVVPGSSGIKLEPESPLSKSRPPHVVAQSPLATPLPGSSTIYSDPNMDAEVSLATQGISRQSSIGSYSHSRETPSEMYSDSDSDRSSPIDTCMN